MSSEQVTTLNRYANGKIYKIYVQGSDTCYVGSTCTLLYKRMNSHRSDYKRYLDGTYNYVSSFEILENPNAIIELVEDYPCERKEQLNMREGYYIRITNCVNRHISGAIAAAGGEQVYRLEYSREYNETNREQINVRQRQYNEINREQINAKITCEICNCQISRSNFSKHNKSQKHIRNSASS